MTVWENLYLYRLSMEFYENIEDSMNSIYENLCILCTIKENHRKLLNKRKSWGNSTKFNGKTIRIGHCLKEPLHSYNYL